MIRYYIILPMEDIRKIENKQIVSGIHYCNILPLEDDRNIEN